MPEILLRVAVGLVCLLVICEVCDGLQLRDKSASTVKESTGRQDPAPGDDDLDSLFKDDQFFTDFDQSVKQRRQMASSTSAVPAISASTTIPSTEVPDAEHLKGKFDIQQLPAASASTSTSTPSNTSSQATSAAVTDCRTGQKTFLDTANDGFTSITDTLLGLVGLSSMQTAVYPVIMILVAGVTGIFWAAVFWYLYSKFFKGGGNDEFGFGFIKKDKFKQNKYNNYGPGSSSSAYGRNSDLDIDWDFYTKILSNIASYGWDKIVDSYGME